MSKIGERIKNMGYDGDYMEAIKRIGNDDINDKKESFGLFANIYMDCNMKTNRYKQGRRKDRI